MRLLLTMSNGKYRHVLKLLPGNGRLYQIIGTWDGVYFIPHPDEMFTVNEINLVYNLLKEKTK